MANQANSGTRAVARAGGETSRPELDALRPLVRTLARDAAREAWSVPQDKDQTPDDPHDPSARS